MIDIEMEKALNDHMNEELYSSHLYKSMAAYLESNRLPGFAHWMNKQADEEDIHAQKIFRYINDRRGRARFESIECPPQDWENPLAAFKAAFEHEQKITKQVNDLVNLAISLKDHATNYFIQEGFVKEQIQEETAASDIVDKLLLVGPEKSGLFLVDRELGSR